MPENNPDSIETDFEYSFQYWTDSSSNPSSVIDTTTSDPVDTSRLITKNTTLYAVYKKGAEVKYTVTLKSFNPSSTPAGYTSSTELTGISYGIMFSEIQKPQDPSDVFIGSIKYSFVGWADVQDPQAILEEYNNTDVPGNTQIKENKTFYAIYKGDYLTFTAVENTEISFDVGSWNSELPNPVSLQYRIEDVMTEFANYTWDNGSKTQVSTIAIGDKISLRADKKIYFKGNNPTFSKSSALNITFKSTGEVKASGNVMSLVGGGTTIPNEFCFAGLFYGCDKLLTAPDLPAETLTNYCYWSMFYDCTSLTEAPSLPAEALTEGCYQHMFYNCKSLTTAPSLSAIELKKKCYYHMFEKCISLTSITCLATEITASDCLSSWVSEVASSGTFKYKAVASWPSGESGIPAGWTRENL